MKAAFATTLIAAGLAAAAPLEKRNNGGGASAINDFVILQYALTLEHLEDTFYRQGLANFTESDFTDAGYDASVRARIVEIGGHEKTHVSFLTTALSGLGQKPVAECTYAFGVTDVKTFLATASILEGVGVSAYLGAAAFIMEKAYLTAAGSILTVESRHSSYIRNAIKADPFPAAFDVPLLFNEVYSLAAGFITSCPKDNVALPVKAFPALAAAPGANKPGALTKLTPAKPLKHSGKVYAAWIGFPANAYGEWDPVKMTVETPKYGFSGQSYVVLTSSPDSVTDDNVLAGPAVVEITAT